MNWYFRQILRAPASPLLTELRAQIEDNYNSGVTIIVRKYCFPFLGLRCVFVVAMLYVRCPLNVELLFMLSVLCLSS